jgi:phosphate/sulfate permease
MHEGTIIAAIFLSFSSETLASNRNKKETRMKGKRKKGNNKKRKLHATGNIYEA